MIIKDLQQFLFTSETDISITTASERERREQNHIENKNKRVIYVSIIKW